MQRMVCADPGFTGATGHSRSLFQVGLHLGGSILSSLLLLYY